MNSSLKELWGNRKLFAEARRKVQSSPSSGGQEPRELEKKNCRRLEDSILEKRGDAHEGLVSNAHMQEVRKGERKEALKKGRGDI